MIGDFPFLTPPSAPGISFLVIRALLPATMICLASLPAAAQVAVPPEVEQSALAAVNNLGQQVVLGRFQVAIDRMFPPYKESLAKSVGGVEKLQEKLGGAGKAMAEQGIQILSFRTESRKDPLTGIESKFTAYEVESGKEVVQENGKPVEKMIFKKWLLLIPTVTEFRMTAPGKAGELPKMHVIANHSFQVAISDKGKNDWTFIDGSGLRISDLRRMFFTLPENMTLPEIRSEEKQPTR